MDSGSAPTPPRADLFKVLDVFVRPRFGADSYALSRARALAGTNLMLIAVFGAAFFHLFNTQALGSYSEPFLWYVLLPVLLINLLVPVLLLRFGYLALGQHLTIATTFVAAFSGIFLNGGPVTASSTQTILIIIPLAFFLLGRRGGLIWGGASLAVVLGMYAVHFAGYDYPNLQPAEAIATGEVFNFLLCFVAMVAFLMLIESNRQHLESLRNAERERLRYLANHDGLTRLANRVLFEKRLKEAVECPKSNDEVCAMLYIDLNDFKPINDKFGHAIGDEVLKIIGLRLQSAVRDSDTVARLGGDEFAIILNRFPKSRSVEEMAAIVYDRIAQPITLGTHSFLVHGTLGISQQRPDSTPSSLWQESDSAMYKAKHEKLRWHLA